MRTKKRNWRVALLCLTGAVAGTGAVLSAPALKAADAPAPARGGSLLAASAPTVRLISQSQYANTIKQIFGEDITLDMRMAPVNRIDGLVAVGASQAVLTPGALAPLERAARGISGQVVDKSRRAALIPCTPANEKARDDACARQFLGKVGHLIYRRKLSDAELGNLVNLAGSTVGPAGDFYAGLAYALSGMLTSPDFLFVRETIEPDPSTPAAMQLDSYSKAARLSFLLWDASPDEALLTAAEKGELNKPAGVRREVERMIASPLYENAVRGFFRDFLVLEDIDSISKDMTVYPDFLLTMATAAREQVLRVVSDHLIARHGDVRDLMTTRRTFLNRDLGILYRLPVKAGPDGWGAYEFAANDSRAGLLTQIGFLATYAHAARSSPTRRGRAIREVLLCQKVPDPPPNVDFSNFENPKSPLPTARARLMRHQENPICAGCHKITDPIGLSLENFDGAGMFRTVEGGANINASGELDGVKFTDAPGLGKALRDNENFKACVVNRLYAYSVGRKITPAEEPRLQQIQATLDKTGYQFDNMLKLIVLDRSFFAVRQPTPATSVAFNATPTGGKHAD